MSDKSVGAEMRTRGNPDDDDTNVFASANTTEPSRGVVTMVNPYMKPRKRQVSGSAKLSRSSQEKSAATKAPASSRSTDEAEKGLVAETETVSEQPRDISAGDTAVDVTNAAYSSGSLSVATTTVTDAVWERLPSRNVSFESAEVLTVTEVCQHGPLHYLDRSVRTTGVVLQRHVIRDERTSVDGNHTSLVDSSDDVWVCLVVGDPLEQRPLTKGTRMSARYGPSSSTKHHPYSRSATASSTKTRTLIQSNALFKTPASKRAPVAFRGSSTVLERRSAFSSGHETNGLGSGKTPRTLVKRPLLSSLKKCALNRTPAKKDPINVMESCLKQTKSSVLVVCRSVVPVIRDVATGDLVMVIARVVPIHLGGDAPTTRDHPKCLEPLLDRISGDEVGAIRPPIYMEARVARSVNGTDMRLHQEALMLRRKFMQQVHGSDTMLETDAMPRIGCGPPVLPNATAAPSDGS